MHFDVWCELFWTIFLYENWCFIGRPKKLRGLSRRQKWPLSAWRNVASLSFHPNFSVKTTPIHHHPHYFDFPRSPRSFWYYLRVNTQKIDWLRTLFRFHCFRGFWPRITQVAYLSICMGDFGWVCFGPCGFPIFQGANIGVTDLGRGDNPLSNGVLRSWIVRVKLGEIGLLKTFATF